MTRRWIVEAEGDCWWWDIIFCRPLSFSTPRFERSGKLHLIFTLNQFQVALYDFPDVQMGDVCEASGFQLSATLALLRWKMNGTATKAANLSHRQQLPTQLLVVEFSPRWSRANDPIAHRGCPCLPRHLRSLPFRCVHLFLLFHRDPSPSPNLCVRGCGGQASFMESP